MVSRALPGFRPFFESFVRVRYWAVHAFIRLVLSVSPPTPRIRQTADTNTCFAGRGRPIVHRGIYKAIVPNKPGESMTCWVVRIISSIVAERAKDVAVASSPKHVWKPGSSMPTFEYGIPESTIHRSQRGLIGPSHDPRPKQFWSPTPRIIHPTLSVRRRQATASM